MQFRKIEVYRVGAALSLVSLLALAGCGQDQGNADQGSAEQATAEPSAQPEIEAPVADAVASAAVEADASQEDMDAEAFMDEPAEAPMINPDAEDIGEDLYRRGFPLEAMALWEANAESGDAYAAYRLGVEYFDAHHVERDVPLAIRYQQLASDLGNGAAMFELGSFYEAGLGLPQSFDQAAGWYLASAQHGYGPAQHNVATMFEEGLGLPRDLVQAYLFYGLAIQQGFSLSFDATHEELQAAPANQLERLAQLMSGEEIDEAEALIENFSPIE